MAFDVELDNQKQQQKLQVQNEQQNDGLDKHELNNKNDNIDNITKMSNNIIDESEGNRGYEFRLPRKLPNLSSLTTRTKQMNQTDQTPLTSEGIMEKQRKAEEKRLSFLQQKKQKARKFVEKFNGIKNSNLEQQHGNSSQEGDEESGKEKEEDPSTPSTSIQTTALVGNSHRLNGLDSGLGLDRYGLDGGGDESGGDEKFAMKSTKSNASLVVQDGVHI